jgi:hypothetical protein
VAKVAPDEHELRRVIDEDREVYSLVAAETFTIYCYMIILRTYNKRSDV